MHEAGHGSISTIDTAYGHVGMLIEFLADYPDIAEGNTDSYTLMVLCLKGFPGYCAPRELVLVTELPRTSIGKVRRQLLPDTRLG